MGTSLQLYEDNLKRDIMPRLEKILLAAPDLPPQAFLASFMESLKAAPRLADCTMPSVYMAATTLGSLGVMPGPFLGQGWLIPRKSKGVWMANAQLGYKGLNTIAARGGRTIESGVIRKADKYEIRQGTTPRIDVWPNIENPSSEIIAAWSVQEFGGRRVSPLVIPVKELLAIKENNSKGAMVDDAEKAGFSPWNDPKVGYPAMCQKTAVLRQKRSLPFGMFHYAAAMDDLQEQGRGAWIVPDDNGNMAIVTDDNERIRPRDEGPVIDHDEPLPPELHKVEFTLITGYDPDGKPVVKDFNTVADWRSAFLKLIEKTPPKFMPNIRQANGGKLMEVAKAGYTRETNDISHAIAEKENQAK